MSNFFRVQKTPSIDTRQPYIGKYAVDTLNTNTSNVYVDDFRLFNSALDIPKSQLVYYGQTLISGLAPTNLRIIDISNNSVRIQYKANSGASSYEIRTAPETSTWTTTDVSYTLTGLDIFTPYTIYVFGVQADGKKSNAVKVSVLEPPENIVVSPSAANDRVDIQYSASFGATKYQIQTTPASTTLQTTSLTPSLTGASPDISYVVTIYARDSSGYSMPVSKKINERPPYFLITDITNTTLSLLYGAVSGASYYEIYTVPATRSVTTTSTAIDISGLTAGTAYTVYIKAGNTVTGNSSFYGSISVSIPDSAYYYKFDSGVPNRATPITGINADNYININGTYNISSSSFSTGNNSYKAFDGSSATVWENNTPVVNVNGNLGSTYLSTTSLGTNIISGTDLNNFTLNSCRMEGDYTRVAYTSYPTAGTVVQYLGGPSYIGEYSPDTNKIYMFTHSNPDGNTIMTSITYDVSLNSYTKQIISNTYLFHIRKPVYAPNTKKMYSICGYGSIVSPKMLVFDTITNNYNYYDISMEISPFYDWSQGTYVSSNKTIVFMPFKGSKILEFNTLNNTATYYTSPGMTNKYSGCAYFPATNKVYGMPNNTFYICSFDCSTKDISLNHILADVSGYTRCVFHPAENLIYGFTDILNVNATDKFLRVNPIAKTAVSFSTGATGYDAIYNPYNNKLYCGWNSSTNNKYYVMAVSTTGASTINIDISMTSSDLHSIILANNLNMYPIGGSILTKIPITSTKTAGSVPTTIVRDLKTTSTSTLAAYLTGAYDISFIKMTRIEFNVNSGRIYAYQSDARYNGNTTIPLTESGINSAYERGIIMATGSAGFGITNLNYQNISTSYAYDASGKYTGSYNTTLNTGTASGEWLQLSVPYPLQLTQYTINSRTATPNEMPRIFTVAGSNNGTTWIDIDTRTVTTSLTTPPAGTTYTATVNTVNYYTYFRLIVKNIYQTRQSTAVASWDISGKTAVLANYNSGALVPTYDSSAQPFSINNTTFIRGVGSAYLNSAAGKQYITIPPRLYSSANPQFSAAMWVNIASNVRKPIFEMGATLATDSAAFSQMNLTGYWGAVVAPNNRVYFTPSDTSNVLVIDPSTNTTFATIPLGLTSTSKWGSSILAPNGKIYAIPRDHSSVLIVDPSTNTADTTTIQGISGTNKYLGGAIASNGKIYCPPYDLNVNGVLVINTNNNTTSLISTQGKSGWSDAVLANNGKIYGVPYNATSVIIIDPSTDTVDTSAILISGTNMYGGGALASNGNIYCAPMDASNILVINPTSNTISNITGLGTVTGKYRSVVASQNGRLYGIPYNATNVLIIDPITNTINTSTISTGLTGTTKFGDGAAAFNGNIYVAPYTATAAYVISPYTKSLGIDISNGYPRFLRYSHSNASTAVTQQYTMPVQQSAANNGWNHLGISVDTSGQWTMYLNGLPYNTGITDAFYFVGINNKFAPPQNYIGRYISDTAATNTPTAYIDDFRVYSNAMDLSFASMLYQGSGFVSPSSSPTNLTIVDISTSSITVSYTANTKAASYVIRIVPETVAQTTTTSTNVQITGISPSPTTNTYTVYVYGVNSGGYLSYPAIKSTT